MTETTIQIRFSDVDMLGHVNNVRLQEYYDLGKSTYFATVLALPPIWKERGFIAAATSSSYIAEVKYQDSLVVTTKISKIGTKSITIYQEIIETNSSTVKSNSTSVLVAFNPTNHQSIEIPKEWREKIERHETNE